MGVRGRNAISPNKTQRYARDDRKILSESVATECDWSAKFSIPRSSKTSSIPQASLAHHPMLRKRENGPALEHKRRSKLRARDLLSQIEQRRDELLSLPRFGDAEHCMRSRNKSESGQRFVQDGEAEEF